MYTILCITMKTTPNHSWSPRDLLTRLHAQRSCDSRSWIGHKACAQLDGSWLNMLFLPHHGFTFHRLLCFLQPFYLQNRLPVPQRYIQPPRSPQFQPVCNTYELMSLGNHLPTSIQGFADTIECWQCTRSRQVGLILLAPRCPSS